MAAGKHHHRSFSSSVVPRHGLLTEMLLVAAIVAIGVLFRVEDMGQWEKNDKRAFVDGQPLHTTFDAYFYLSLSKDLVDGTYRRVDEKRAVPDHPARPSPPPLLSVLAAQTHRATGFSLTWIGAVLPAILGPLLVVPLYLLARFYGGPPMGVAAALVAATCQYYVGRSSIGRFDTDCMNLTWSVTAAYLFLLFGTEHTKKRYGYCIGGFIVFGLFWWWWDQAPAVVFGLSFLPFVVALIFFYRPPGREGFVFLGLLCLLVAAFLAVKGVDPLLEITRRILSRYQYIAKQAHDDFPNIGLSISEQVKPTLGQIVSYTTAAAWSFCFSLLGLLLLFITRFKHSLFLVSLVITSSLAFLYSDRFILFLVPLISIGTGYGIAFLWGFRNRFKPLALLCPALLAGIVLPLYTENERLVAWPVEHPQIAKGILAAGEKTPPDAVVWAWWDHGYAINYLARRATVNDGSVHSGERTVYNAIPLASQSFRLSANFMQFYVRRGMSGIREFYRAVGNDRARGLSLIKEILAAGPKQGRELIQKAAITVASSKRTVDEWLEFFFPAERRPVYLFLDQKLTRTAYWWYWFGAWDISSQTSVHPLCKPFFGIHQKGAEFKNDHDFRLDPKNGYIHVGKKGIPISHLSVLNGAHIQEKDFPHNSGFQFELSIRTGVGMLMDRTMAQSVFAKLFVRQRTDRTYFLPVNLRMPFYQIWKVGGDTINPKTDHIGPAS